MTAARQEVLWAWVSRILVVLVLLLSVVVRARNLSSPLDEEHSFRQTQTAITVWAMVDEGIRFFDYQTPLFGPPWRVPFEFPVFQAVVAALTMAGAGTIDAMCRVTALLFFYLSGAVLYALCKRHFDDPRISVCILTAYVWFPFTVYWSRTAMIDYASVTFALGYLYCLEGWLCGAGSGFSLAGAVVFGCLSTLIKPTTTPIVAVAVVWAVLHRLRADTQVGTTWRDVFRLWARSALGIAVATLTPLAAAWAWTAYADAIKAASVATQWLVSSNLTPWTYGTWDQRTKWSLWSGLFYRMWAAFTPGSLIIFPAAGLLGTVVHRRAGGRFVLAMVIGAVATLFTFFNLHVIHNYYQMALSPALAVLTGVGLYDLCIGPMQSRMARWVIPLLVLNIVYGAAEGALGYPLQERYETCGMCQCGAAVRNTTSPDEHVIVEGYDWSSNILYYARRKGLMWRGSIEGASPAYVARWLKESGFTTVVAAQEHPSTLRFWAAHEVVAKAGCYIFKVWD